MNNKSQFDICLVATFFLKIHSKCYNSFRRSRFVFKIVPMLNVEGVINGSHRCGPTGEDLNRRWAEPNPEAHPEVHRAKGMVEYLSRVKGRAPDLFVDYHGHSR